MTALSRLELTARPLPAHADLSDLPFAVALGHARALSATGELRLQERKSVYLSRGAPVAIRTDFPDEISEVYMLRHGVVAEADLEPLRRLAAARHQRFSEALLGAGMLEASQLYEHSRLHAQQTLTTCFRWEQGPIEFTPLETLGRDVLPLPLDLLEVFVTGVARFYDRNRLERELPLGDFARIYAKPVPELPTGGGSLGTIDARLVQLAAGRPTIPALASAVGLSEHVVRQRLYVLYCLGVVGFEDGPPPIATKPISRIATIPAFAAPSPRPARVPTPAVSMPPAAVPKRRPTRPLTSPAPVAVERKQAAGVHKLLEDAEIARLAGQHHVAIGALRSALTMSPQNPRVLAQLALTLMVCDERLHAREANRLAREARRIDPELAVPYVVIGLLMQQIGEEQGARAMYQTALKHDPECAEAMRFLDKLDE